MGRSAITLPNETTTSLVITRKARLVKDQLRHRYFVDGQFLREANRVFSHCVVSKDDAGEKALSFHLALDMANASRAHQQHKNDLWLADMRRKLVGGMGVIEAANLRERTALLASVRLIIVEIAYAGEL